MSSEDFLPCVLFVSCSEGGDVGKLMEIVNPDVICADDRSLWKIDTKYYEACVRLVPFTVDGYDDLRGDVLENAGGLVLHYDGDFAKSVNRLKTVAEKVVDCDAVKLLVCDSCEPEDSRVLAEEWCVEQGFEHLELQGPEADESRLRQALEAHVWPNLVQKTSKKDKKNSQKAESSTSGDLDDEFSTLFQHLATMKEQAAGLPSDERKNFAEQVVLAYWRSIGGDEDELLDV